MKLWPIFEYCEKAVENQIWDILIKVFFFFALKSVKKNFVALGMLKNVHYAGICLML